MNAEPPGADPLPYAVLLRQVQNLRTQIRDRRTSAPDPRTADAWRRWERHINEELRSHPLNDDLVRLAERLENALRAHPGRGRD